MLKWVKIERIALHRVPLVIGSRRANEGNASLPCITWTVIPREIMDFLIVCLLVFRVYHVLSF